MIIGKLTSKGWTIEYGIENRNGRYLLELPPGHEGHGGEFVDLGLAIKEYIRVTGEQPKLFDGPHGFFHPADF